MTSKVNDTHIGTSAVLYSISLTNKQLQRRTRKSMFSLTQSAMNTFPATLLVMKTFQTHTHEHLLKTRISRYHDFSWWSTSSTCMALACPGHISFISVNHPLKCLSILQHKEIDIVHVAHAPHIQKVPLRCMEKLIHS